VGRCHRAAFSGLLHVPWRIRKHVEIRIAIVRAEWSARRVTHRIPTAPVDLVTIAFSNASVLRQQHRLLGRYVTQPFVWIVADNSPDRESASVIRNLCKELGVAYWRIPQNPYTRVSPSHSHGFALNLAWRCLLRRRVSFSAGFLDHDVFPLEPFDPCASVSRQAVWGRCEQRGEHWYIWPGLMFVRTSDARQFGLDFLPGHGTDTGGRNEALLLRDLDPDLLTFPEVERMPMRGDGSVNESDFFERIDGWLHTINGSNWFPAPSKEAEIELFLSRY